MDRTQNRKPLSLARREYPPPRCGCSFTVSAVTLDHVPQLPHPKDLLLLLRRYLSLGWVAVGLSCTCQSFLPVCLQSLALNPSLFRWRSALSNAAGQICHWAYTLLIQLWISSVTNVYNRRTQFVVESPHCSPPGSIAVGRTPHWCHDGSRKNAKCIHMQVHVPP